MIFQMAIDLNIEGREAQAIIDLDTGLIGFTEKVGTETHEYNYLNCPKNFRISFIEVMSDKISKKHNTNFEICRKAKAAELLRDLWGNDSK